MPSRAPHDISRSPFIVLCPFSCAGFKYFGLLNGLAFAVSGVSQVFMSALVSTVQGTCHNIVATPASSTSCSPGQWNSLHVAELLLLAVLMLAPRVTR
jgi:hypothetical protein